MYKAIRDLASEEVRDCVHGGGGWCYFVFLVTCGVHGHHVYTAAEPGSIYGLNPLYDTCHSFFPRANQALNSLTHARKHNANTNTKTNMFMRIAGVRAAEII